MNSKFKEYLSELGMGNILIDKVEESFLFFETNFIEEIEDIFVEEYITQDGSREYISVQFFSSEHVFEVQNFMITNELTCFPYINCINTIHIIKEDYDFNEANDNSKFEIKYSTDRGTITTLKSSKRNCDHLKNIFEKYLRPNIRK